jgi:hypothetical protein
VVVVVAGIVSLVFGQLLDARLRTLPEWVPIASGLAAWVVLSIGGSMLIKLRRASVRRRIDQLEAAWNDERHARNLPRRETGPSSPLVSPTPSDSGGVVVD